MVVKFYFYLYVRINERFLSFPMTKNKNKVLKGGYKYKQIRRRFGKKNPEPVRKVIRTKELQNLSNPVYTSSSTIPPPVEFEYFYTPSPPKKPKIVPKPGRSRGEG